MKKQDENLDQDLLVDEQDSSTDKTDLSQVEIELDELKQQFAQTQDQLKRAIADYHNLEKRISEGRAEMASWASAQLLKRILPTLDHLEITIKGAGETERQSGWFKGIEMSVKQLQQVLKEEGLTEVAATGQFDPALHEAVDTKEGNNGEVLEVVEKGYNLNGKVLRPAKVIVGRKGD